MTIHIALLRAVNVGGRKPIIMAELRDLLTELGFVGARSLSQTGNLVFRSKALTGNGLERLLEEEAAKRLDLHTDFFVRTAGRYRPLPPYQYPRRKKVWHPRHSSQLEHRSKTGWLCKRSVSLCRPRVGRSSA